MSPARSRPIADIVRDYAVTKRFLGRCEALGLLRIEQHGPRQCLGRADEDRLQTILKGLKLGFTLHELKMLFDAELRTGTDRSAS